MIRLIDETILGMSSRAICTNNALSPPFRSFDGFRMWRDRHR